MTPYEKWDRQHVTDLAEIISIFNEDKPTIGGFDTESTGLHIIRDKAFLIQFGWLVPNEDYGRVFTFYPTETNMTAFLSMCALLKWNVAWNTKFDLHMIMNATGIEYQYSNLVEGMAIARLCVEAIPLTAGGDSLALKSIGVNYVHYLAGENERKVKHELDVLNKERIKVLTVALKQFPIEGEFTATGRQKFWGKGAIEDFLKDPTQDVEDLPKDIADVWADWQEEYPKPTYEDIDREVMISYAGDDVITMLEYVRKALPTIKAREQEKTLERECRLIKPLWRMERVGIKCDRDYLASSRIKMKNYIKLKREELCALAGVTITVGQHDKLKEIFAAKWNIHLESADKKALSDIKEQYDGEPKQFAEIISALRRLEKWYSTYLNRILESSSYDGRFYTQISQCSAITGRVGSDAQQFPKESLLTEEGKKLAKSNQLVPESEELFCPRKTFLVSGGDYDETVYIDYSQVELRDQADYTIRVSGGDLNLCRAYMPFKCKHIETGEIYDYTYSGGKNRWNEKDDEGNSVWVIPETKERWSPTDVHSLTTHNALMLLGYTCHEKHKSYSYDLAGIPFFNKTIDAKGFKDVRNKGKTFNFMKNYGGGMGAAMSQLNLPESVAKALIDGYEQAFPHVVIYQRKIVQQHAKKGYIQNMKGRRYYLQNTRLGYKLANYAVQGTCADELKEAIILIDTFLVSNGYKTRFQMNIHDELSFEKFRGEEHIIPQLRDIMESVFDSWCYVPIVAEISVSSTNWYEKKDWSEEA